LELEQWTNMNLPNESVPPSIFAVNSNNYNFSHKTFTAWKVEKTTAHQRLITKVQKPEDTLIQAQNYPFLSKYMNSIS
jgi:hypothetical protein